MFLDLLVGRILFDMNIALENVLLVGIDYLSFLS